MLDCERLRMDLVLLKSNEEEKTNDFDDNKCQVCSTNRKAQYQCPKCLVRYCSVQCYKQHSSKCLERFACDNFLAMAKNETCQEDDEDEDGERAKTSVKALLRKYKRLELIDREDGALRRERRRSLSEEEEKEEEEYDDDDDDDDDDYDDDDSNNNNERCKLSSKLMRAYLRAEEKRQEINVEDFTASDKKRFEKFLRKGMIKIEPWVAWWTADKVIELRADGTAKIIITTAVTMNDDDEIDDDDDDDEIKTKPRTKLPSPPIEPLPSYETLLPKQNNTSSKIEQRNIFRENVSEAITLYAIIARAFNGEMFSDLDLECASTFLASFTRGSIKMKTTTTTTTTTTTNNNNHTNETEEDVRELIARTVFETIRKQTMEPSGLFYDVAKHQNVARNLEADAYRLLETRTYRVLALEDARRLFTKSLDVSKTKEDNTNTDDDDDELKKKMKLFRSEARKLERKLFFSECFANVSDEIFFAKKNHHHHQPSLIQIRTKEKALPETTISISKKETPRDDENEEEEEEEQLTFAPCGHIVSNAYAWNSLGEWLCYDIRSDKGGHLFDGDRIEIVNVETKEVKTVLQSENGAKCGVALFHPTDPYVLCAIMGPQNPTKEWSYLAHHRRGVVVNCHSFDSSSDDGFHNKPNDYFYRPDLTKTKNLEARDLLSPFTPGALRGGTHVHAFSPNGKLVSMTYEDAVLADSANENLRMKNARNIAVTIYCDSSNDENWIRVDKTLNDRNVSGGFTVCVTETTPTPKFGSDEISRAYEDCWIDDRTLSFLGDCRNDRGELVTELFICELPENIQNLKRQRSDDDDRKIEGTETSYPMPPTSVLQRRITRTANGGGCQGSVRFWPRADPVDPSSIAILLKDLKGVFQIFLVSTITKNVEQLTSNDTPIASAFSWDPKKGEFICYALDGQIAKTFTKGSQKGRTVFLTSTRGRRKKKTIDVEEEEGEQEEDIRPECCVVSPDAEKVCFVKTTRPSGYNQIFSCSTKTKRAKRV